MTALPTFTVVCDGIDSVGIDYVDPNDVEPDEHTIFAFVTFRARLNSDTVIWLAGATPPRGIQLDEVKARFAPEDGVLRTIVGEPTNEKQHVVVTGNPWSVSFSGQPTSNLANTATAAQFDAALEALSNIGVNEVYVSGANGGPFDVTFHGTLGYSNVPVMVGTNATVTTVTEGTLDAGVKLVANTALLDLDDPLIYDVTFEIPESTRKIAPFAFTAPTTNGATIDLATVTKLPPREPGTFE